MRGTDKLIRDGLMIIIGASIGLSLGVMMRSERLYENHQASVRQATHDLEQCYDRLVKTDRIVRAIWRDWAPDTRDQ